MDVELTEQEKDFLGSLSALLVRYNVKIVWHGDVLGRYMLQGEGINLSSSFEDLLLKGEL